MRLIYLIAPFVLSKLSLWKQDSKDIGICPLSNTFIGFVPFWSEGCRATRHCVKGNQTEALVSVHLAFVRAMQRISKVWGKVQQMQPL